MKIQSFKSDFGKNVLTLFSGTVVAQATPFIFSPIISRLFLPSEFGLFAIFTSFVSLFTVLSSFQYDLAIVLPKEDIDAFHLLVLSFLITVSLSLISVVIIFFWGEQISDLLGAPAIKNMLWLMPLSLLLSGTYKILNSWATRFKQYKRISFREITQSISQSTIKVGLGLSSFSGGLILGQVLGELVSISSIIFNTLKKDNLSQYPISLSKMKQLAREYEQFPKYSSPQSFMDIFSKNIIVFLLNFFFSASVLGLYSFANSILRKPMTIIGNNIRQVYYQKASDIYNKRPQKLWVETRKVIVLLIFAAVIMFLPLIFFGPLIFSVVFGEKWLEAGVYAQYLSPWLMANFIMSPISSLPMVINKQKEYFLLSTVTNILIPLLMLLFFWIGFDLRVSLLFISFVVFVISLYVLFWLRKICINLGVV